MRVVAVTDAPGPVMPFDIIVLAHDERHLRRRVLTLQHGDRVLVDLPRPVRLRGRERLVLDDGRHVEVIAAEEHLLEVRGNDAAHLLRLAWHIGNRHLAAEINVGGDDDGDRILILRDRVIADMLRGLGATVREVSEPFEPEGGAYGDAHAAHSHGGHGPHSHAHGPGGHHDHR